MRSHKCCVKILNDASRVSVTAAFTRKGGWPRTGRVLDDEVKNEVFLFMWKGDFNVRTARWDLLDAGGRVVRSDPMRRQR